MQIEMLNDKTCFLDNGTVIHCETGETHDLPVSICEILLKHKCAKEVLEDKSLKVEEMENKSAKYPLKPKGKKK